jgi:hypothetical protein
MARARILFVFTRAVLALAVIVAAVFPTWAPLQVPKIDDRSFKDLTEAVESLGDGLRSRAPSPGRQRPQRAAAAPGATPRQTPKTDFGAVANKGSSCCERELDDVRAAFKQIRADRKRLAKMARAERDRKALKKIEQLDSQIRSFEEALDGLEDAETEKQASRQLATLSNVSKSMHDTAKAIIQNMRG